MPRTLVSFEWLLKPGEHIILCPQMFLDGWHDDHSPIFSGSGRFVLNGTTEIHFEFDARAEELADGIRALRRCAEEPNEVTSAMRLRGIDHRGTQWNAGWVRPSLADVKTEYFQLFGESGALTTHVQQFEPSSGVELIYSPAPDIPFSEIVTTTDHFGETTFGGRKEGGKHRMEVLGSTIEAMIQPWSGELWLCASTSDELPHPYLENWLSEPLRALHGQLIYPRLVARC